FRRALLCSFLRAKALTQTSSRKGEKLMPKKSASKKKTAAPAALSSLPTFRAGMPALDSIIAVRPLTPPAAPGAPGAPGAAPTSAYRIITTNEVDAYDAGATPHEILAAGAPAPPAPAGDNFAGT